MNKKMTLLHELRRKLDKAAAQLTRSLNQCAALEKKMTRSEDEEDKLEALGSRFARMSDMLVQQVFRLIDEIDLDSTGTVRDRINRAEKKGLISSAREFIDIYPR